MYFICWPSILIKTCFPYQELYQIVLNYESLCFKKRISKFLFWYKGGGVPTRTTRLCPEYCSLLSEFILSSPISILLNKSRHFYLAPLSAFLDMVSLGPFPSLLLKIVLDISNFLSLPLFLYISIHYLFGDACNVWQAQL